MASDSAGSISGTLRRDFSVAPKAGDARGARRDTRLDVLRGLALITIFINHVPGQVLERLTTKNFGFSDAAEAFVLISGIAVGLAYGKSFVPGSRLKASVKAIKRAFTLYLAHMITTFITLVFFVSGAWLFNRAGLLCEISILPVLTNLKAGIPALMLLGHQIGYNNILPMYGALLLMVPLILAVEAKSPLLALAVSGSVWLFAGIYQIAPHTMLLEGYWFLNPLSWQFLFTIGIVSTMHVRRGGTLPRHPLLLALAASYAAFSLIWVVLELWSIGDVLASFGLPTVITGFDKTFLSLPRLLHVLALAYLILNVPALSQFFTRRPDHPLTVLGRHSLNIFVAGTILAMAGQVWLYVSNGDRLTGLCYVIAGILVQFAYAHFLERKRLQSLCSYVPGSSGGRALLPVRALAWRRDGRGR
ncbi:OpgC family protein [Rhizobium sp. RAF56]|uniref:OpgC family protein n=1 Tax=Rhizobium sp. RAF56 TaxID=3233062 RepID=UPI003F9CFEB5